MLQYLFGELSIEESAQFEDAYLKNDNVFHELVALENETIDQYVQGGLSGTERERFEKSLLRFPARREAVETARSLLAYSATTENEFSFHQSRPVQVERRPPGKYRNWGSRIAAAVLLVTIGALFWLIVNNRRLGNELARLQREQAIAAQDKQELQRRIDGLQADLKQQYDVLALMPLPSHDTVSFTLGSGISRGGGAPEPLVVPARSHRIILRVSVEDNVHSHYSVSVRTADDRLLWHKDSIQGRQIDGYKEIVATLPSSLLPTGDYVFRVSTKTKTSFTQVAGYSFRVVRQ